MSTEASLSLELNSEDGVNGSKILHPQNRGIKTCYFHWNTGVLQNKLVQSEGLFGRLVSIQTSEKMMIKDFVCYKIISQW